MKQTSLHIPTPCHENWNAMTPSEKGKFCHQCNQQVVDFTLMSDAQVLRYLSSHSGRLCGRFGAEQLNRPLLEASVPKKKSWYLALSLPFLLLFQKSTAQVKTHTTGTPAIAKTEHRIWLGDTVMPVASIAPKWITLHGSVRDEKGNPMPYASVNQKTTWLGTMSDSAGNFLIKLRTDEDTVTLIASRVGYAPVEKKVNINQAQNGIELMFTTLQPSLREVVVTGYASSPLTSYAGGVSICRRITKTEKADSLFRKITGTSFFTIYPNPATPGSEVKLNIRKAGQYELQLLNNNSVFLQTEMVQAAADGTITSFILPSQVASGVYYLRLINTGDRKSFLEKIIIR